MSSTSVWNFSTLLGCSIIIATILMTFIQKNVTNAPTLQYQFNTPFSFQLMLYGSLLLSLLFIFIGTGLTVKGMKIRSQYAKDPYFTRYVAYHNFTNAFQVHNHRGESIANILGQD